jgi:thiol-disulfide isomerase/thioredoxin
MKELKALLAAAIVLTAASAALAASLHVGDPAPPIKVGQWVKGQPVTEFDPDQVYVIEFWATWCPACKQTIPDMTKLASTYKGKATVFSVCVRERVPASQVAAIVKGMGDKIGYAVAIDTPDNFMEDKWAGAADQRPVPSAFIVGRGKKIAWIGLAWDAQKPLDRILAGGVPFAAQPAREPTGDKLEADLAAEMRNLLIEGKFDESIEALIKFDAGNPKYRLERMPSDLWQLTCSNLRVLFVKEERASYGYARRLAEGLLSNDPEALAWLANSIVDDLGDFAPRKPNAKYLKNPDYDLALSAAARAAELTKEQDASVLDIVSKAYEKKGDMDKAAAYAERALGVAQSSKQSQQTIDALKSRLAALKNGGH